MMDEHVQQAPARTAGSRSEVGIVGIYKKDCKEMI